MPDPLNQDGWLWRCARCHGAVLLVADTFAGQGHLATLLDAAQLGTTELMLRSRLLKHDAWRTLITVPPCTCETPRPPAGDDRDAGPRA